MGSALTRLAIVVAVVAVSSPLLWVMHRQRTENASEDGARRMEPAAFACVLVYCYSRRTALGNTTRIARSSHFAFVDDSGRLPTRSVQNLCRMEEGQHLALINPAAFEANSMDGKTLRVAGEAKLLGFASSHVPLHPLPLEENDAARTAETQYLADFHAFLQQSPGGAHMENRPKLALLDRVHFVAHVAPCSREEERCKLLLPRHSRACCSECERCGSGSIRSPGQKSATAAAVEPIVGTRWMCNRVTGRCGEADLCERHYREMLAREKAEAALIPSSPRAATAAAASSPPLSADYLAVEDSIVPPRLLWADSAIELVLNACANYAPLPFVGALRADAPAMLHPARYDVENRLRHRPHEHLLRHYEWRSFGEFRSEFLALGQSLRRLLPRGSLLGLYAPNCRAWLVTEMACLAQGLVSVSVAARYSAPEIVAHIVASTRMKAILVRENQQIVTILSVAENWGSHGSNNHSGGSNNAESPFPIKFLISVDAVSTLSALLLDRAAALHLVVLDYGRLVSLSSALPERLFSPLAHMSPETLSCVVYTSGSTGGRPKGSMRTERLQLLDLQAMLFRPASQSPYGVGELAALPFAWSTGSALARATLMQGSALAIYTGPASALMEEYKRVAPIRIVTVPAVWNELFNRYKAFTAEKIRQMQQRQQQQAVSGNARTEEQAIVDAMLQQRKAHGEKLHVASFTSLAETSETEPFSIAPAGVVNGSFPFLTSFRRTFPLGPRLESVSIGGAASSPELLAFVRTLFQNIAFSHGYGATETGGLTVDGELLAGNEARLLPLPEQGFLLTDKPFPRGELAVRNSRTIPGYFNDEEATVAQRTVDGFWRTGDIVEQIGERRFRLLDRTTSVFKTASGEFVSPAGVEAIWGRSRFVEQVLAYGHATRQGLIAIVVPSHREIVRELRSIAAGGTQEDANEEQLSDADLKQHLHSAAVAELLRADLVRECAASGVPLSHYPNAVLVAGEPFSTENGQLTASAKIARHKVIAAFQQRIDSAYAKLETASAQLSNAAAQHDALNPVGPGQASSLANPASLHGASPSSAERLAALFSRVLDVSQQSLSSTVGIAQLGISSLSAVQISQSVKREFGNADLPVQLLLDRSDAALSLEQLAQMIDAGQTQQSPSERQPTLPHPEEMLTQVMRDVMLPLSAPLYTAPAAPMMELYKRFAIAPTLPTAELHRYRHVLLTGSTGFLGGQLLAELLASELNVIVHCLVRPSPSIDGGSGDSSHSSVSSVKNRLVRFLSSRRLWSADWSPRVLVFPTDSLDLSLLGLSEGVHRGLTLHVETVIHSAAEVNWIAPYAALRGANVVATRNIIRFVAAARVEAAAAAGAAEAAVPPVQLLHVSTAGVAGALEEVHDAGEAEWPRADQLRFLLRRYASGYNLSKFVAELLLARAARSEGTLALLSLHAVVRPGFIGPHSESGDAAPGDFLARYVSTVLQLRRYVACDHSFPFTPVERVARQVLAAAAANGSSRLQGDGSESASSAARSSASGLVRSLHSVADKTEVSLSFAEIGQSIAAAVAAASSTRASASLVSLIPISPESFVTAVQQQPDVALYPLLPVISAPRFFGQRSTAAMAPPSQASKANTAAHKAAMRAIYQSTMRQVQADEIEHKQSNQ